MTGGGGIPVQMSTLEMPAVGSSPFVVRPRTHFLTLSAALDRGVTCVPSAGFPMRFFPTANDHGPSTPAFLPMLLKIESGIRMPGKIPSTCRANVH